MVYLDEGQVERTERKKVEEWQQRNEGIRRSMKGKHSKRVGIEHSDEDLQRMR